MEYGFRRLRSEQPAQAEVLTVADDLSHECKDIAVDYGISGEYVPRLLSRAAVFRGDVGRTLATKLGATLVKIDAANAQFQANHRHWQASFNPFECSYDLAAGKF